MPSPSHSTERAKPLLGTIVRIRVAGLPEARAHEAISGAFGVVSDIHRLMSFHDADSELFLLNTTASRAPVGITAHTRAVLEKALELARLSDGVFDPAIAPALVGQGLLPRPGGETPENAADWRDVVLTEDGSVSFARPLWLDFGGIAKGYAVDCAVAHLETYGPASVCVEAGGDLRLAGPDAELVRLDAPGAGDELPVLSIENASVASSLGTAHVDTRTGAFCPADRFVSVVAPSCIEADALTKVVMAAGPSAAPILERYGARAFFHEGAAWTQVGGSA